ncbi:MAG: helix-turn-helix transcriptional regulator [Chitinophagales bacterium]|nr:helix-turn-helix domain-containing protein [Bacteroidota bacterium]MCB9042981.1 helix-turn-helix domain-containing protein [Chitinophagales bacterium]
MKNIKSTNGVAVEKSFEMYRMEDFYPENQSLAQSNRHDFYMIFYPTEGSGSHLIDFKSYKIEPHKVFLLYPGQVHTWEEYQDLKGFLIFFTTEFFTFRYNNNNLFEFPYFSAARREPFLYVSHNVQERLLRFLNTMLAEYQSDLIDKDKVLRSYVNILLIEFKRLYAHGQQVNYDKHGLTVVRHFEQLISENFKEKHQVKDYAEMLFVTPNYLNAICNKITNKSAGELVRTRIMLEAKRMLLHDDKTVTEIAYELSFKDNSYFCRFFRKYEGLSPETFRKENMMN